MKLSYWSPLHHCGPYPISLSSSFHWPHSVPRAMSPRQRQLVIWQITVFIRGESISEKVREEVSCGQVWLHGPLYFIYSFTVTILKFLVIFFFVSDFLNKGPHFNFTRAPWLRNLSWVWASRARQGFSPDSLWKGPSSILTNHTSKLTQAQHEGFTCLLAAPAVCLLCWVGISMINLEVSRENHWLSFSVSKWVFALIRAS